VTTEEIVQRAAEMLNRGHYRSGDDVLNDWRSAYDKLNGFVDLRKRPDGVWELPK
jgi:hypothetical protein